MTEQEARDEASAEAERRYPVEYPTERDDARGTNPVYNPTREGFIEGAVWLASRAVEAAPSDTDLTALSEQRIPLYAMLDVWMALYGTSHPEFDEFYAKHGYAETWARLLAAVRTSQPVQVEATDDMVEKANREWHRHGMWQPDSPIAPKECLGCKFIAETDGISPNEHRMRAALSAALGGGE